MPQDPTNEISTMVKVMACRHQATSHYLSQCWPKFTSPHSVTSHDELSIEKWEPRANLLNVLDTLFNNWKDGPNLVNFGAWMMDSSILTAAFPTLHYPDNHHSEDMMSYIPNFLINMMKSWCRNTSHNDIFLMGKTSGHVLVTIITSFIISRFKLEIRLSMRILNTTTQETQKKTHHIVSEMKTKLIRSKHVRYMLLSLSQWYLRYNRNIRMTYCHAIPHYVAVIKCSWGRARLVVRFAFHFAIVAAVMHTKYYIYYICIWIHALDVSLYFSCGLVPDDFNHIPHGYFPGIMRSPDCPRTNEATLKYMGKWII